MTFSIRPVYFSGLKEQLKSIREAIEQDRRERYEEIMNYQRVKESLYARLQGTEGLNLSEISDLEKIASDYCKRSSNSKVLKSGIFASFTNRELRILRDVYEDNKENKKYEDIKKRQDEQDKENDEYRKKYNKVSLPPDPDPPHIDVTFEYTTPRFRFRPYRCGEGGTE